MQKIGAVVWSWWGPSPADKPAQLSAAEYAVRAKIAATAQQAARLDYGIGGFYQLTPPGEVLSEPAELTIGYADEEVAGIDEEALAVYTYDEETGDWLLVGGVVDAAGNTVTANISVLGVYTLAPRIPAGEFELKPDMGRLPADGISATEVLSDTVWNNDGTPVAEGTLFDVWSTAGLILGEDADPGRDGVQAAARNGRLSFQFQAGEIALPAEIVARSVAGKATGRTTLELTDAAPPAAPVGLRAVWDGQEVVLSWGANAEVDLAGYRIYYSEGSSGPPYEGIAALPGQPSPVAVGTDTTAQVLGLDSGQTWYFALSAYDILGNESGYSGEVELAPGPTVVEEVAPILPMSPRLEQNFPNPFNAGTAIQFVVPQSGRVRLVVYDILGRPVRSLVEGKVAAGGYTVHWDGKDGRGQSMASGVYLYVLQVEEGSMPGDRRFRQVMRMVLLQ